jgi:hypothetical protein
VIFAALVPWDFARWRGLKPWATFTSMGASRCSIDRQPRELVQFEWPNRPPILDAARTSGSVLRASNCRSDACLHLGVWLLSACPSQSGTSKLKLLEYGFQFLVPACVGSEPLECTAGFLGRLPRDCLDRRGGGTGALLLQECYADGGKRLVRDAKERILVSWCVRPGGTSIAALEQVPPKRKLKSSISMSGGG